MENITKLRNEAPQTSDVLTDVLRRGAQTLSQQAVEAEVQSQLSLVNGSQSLVAAIRNGYSSERSIQTGVGEVVVKQPKAPVKKGREGI